MKPLVSKARVGSSDPAAADASAVAVVACGPGWLVVEKPCGLSLHNEPGADLCSILQASLRAGALPAVGPDAATVHPVHRLDRDTSGLVLLAADRNVVAFFGAQFSARTVGKEYLALVHGDPSSTVDPGDRGEWGWPLTNAAAGRRHPMGKGRRRPCITRWRLLARSRHYALIACSPLSGRRHQIRRHAKLAGHPIVGDRRYGSPRALAYLARTHGFRRLALHAHTLTLRLPGEARTTTFRSGGLPGEIRRLLDDDPQ